MLFGLSKSAEKTPCLNKKWYQGSICLDTKIIFKTENNIKDQGPACTKLEIISRTWMSPAPSPASLLVLNFHQNLEVLFKRFPFSFCWLLLQILKYGHTNCTSKYWLPAIFLKTFLDPEKSAACRLEFHRLPELCALWDQNPRKQSKPTPLQLWKFCKMKTATNWAKAKISPKQK